MAYQTNARTVLHGVTLPRSWFINLIFPSVDFRKDTSAFVKFSSTLIELMHRIHAESQPQRSPTPAPDTEVPGAEVQEDSTSAPNTEGQAETEAQQDSIPDTEGQVEKEAQQDPTPDTEGQVEKEIQQDPAPDTEGQVEEETQQDPAPAPNTEELDTGAHQKPVPASNTEETDAEVQQNPASTSDTEGQPIVDGDQTTDFMGALYIARM